MTTLDCDGALHILRWEAGALSSPEHPDLEGERALSALGAEATGCVAVAEAWARHHDDPLLLVAMRRGGEALGARAPSTGWLYSTNPPTGAVTGSTVARPVSPGRGRKNALLALPAASENSLLRDLHLLAALGPAMERRLVATVTDALLGDPARHPALVASLWGRAAAALREWTGRVDIDVDIQVAEDGTAGISRDGETIRATLPLTWVRDVWAAGTAIVAERFALDVLARTPDRLDLLTVGADLGDPLGIGIDLRPGV